MQLEKKTGLCLAMMSQKLMLNPRMPVDQTAEMLLASLMCDTADEERPNRHADMTSKACQKCGPCHQLPCVFET